jgi:hypothetical protein
LTSHSFFPKLILAGGLALICSACALPPANSTPPQSAIQTKTRMLFSPVTLQANAATAVRDKQVVRARPVKIDLQLLTTASEPGQTITLNLFDDVTLVAQADRIERTERGVSWIGKVQGVPLSQVVIVANGDVVSGNISMPQARYHIRFVGNGVHEVQRIDQAQFPND